MNIKGSCVKSVVDYIKEAYKDEGFEKFLTVLSGEDRKVVEMKILPSSWYDMEFYERILTGINICFIGVDPNLGEKIGKKIITDGLKGIYRVFLGALSQNYILTQSPRLWSRYFDGEKLEILEASDFSLKMGVVGDHKPSQLYCDIMVGAIIGFIEITGGNNVKAEEVACRADGNSRCEFSYTWD
ncbi:hypothetical protein KKC94_02885 [Patescibacteria group bacterium]|nr:hypothetical protein [Patescibacteria group bacterium]